MSLQKRKQQYLASSLLLALGVTVLSTGCAGSRMAVKRDAAWVIPVRCIYFASPKTKCEELRSGGDVYLCREVLIKSACVEPKKDGLR